MQFLLVLLHCAAGIDLWLCSIKCSGKEHHNARVPIIKMWKAVVVHVASPTPVFG